MTTDMQRVAAAEPRRITAAELKALKAAGVDVPILDVRADAAYAASNLQIPGSIRISPHDPSAAGNLPRDRLVVTYCT